VWSYVFYLLLTTERVRWQHSKSIRIVLFYVWLSVTFICCVHEASFLLAAWLDTPSFFFVWFVSLVVLAMWRCYLAFRPRRQASFAMLWRNYTDDLRDATIGHHHHIVTAAVECERVVISKDEKKSPAESISVTAISATTSLPIATHNEHKKVASEQAAPTKPDDHNVLKQQHTTTNVASEVKQRKQHGEKKSHGNDEPEHKTLKTAVENNTKSKDSLVKNSKKQQYDAAAVVVSRNGPIKFKALLQSDHLLRSLIAPDDAFFKSDEDTSDDEEAEPAGRRSSSSSSSPNFFETRLLTSSANKTKKLAGKTRTK
jgi:hypothetical protein